MMGEIRVFFTLQGQIIGQVIDEYMSGAEFEAVRLKDPALIVANGTSVQFVPLGNFVEGHEFELNPDALMFRDSHEPIVPIANKYREIFGSGIQVVGSMPAKPPAIIV